MGLERFVSRIFTVAALAFFSSTAAFAQYAYDYSDLNDSETVRALKSHVSYLSSNSLRGRGAGSEGEKDAAEYVRSMFEEYGIDVISGKDGDLFGISMDGSDTLRSRNVIGFVHGYDRKMYDRYIVVGARLDNLRVNRMTVDGQEVDQIYNGANGNASGLAMLLELARMVNTNALMFRRSIIFIAFGASAQSYAGAWYFLNRSFSDSGNIDAMINLDMLGTGSGGFYAYTSSNADLNALLAGMQTELQPIEPRVTTIEPYPSDHRAFYSKKIPSVFFSSGRYPEYNSSRDVESIIEYGPMEKELEYIYNFTVKLSNVESAPMFNPSDVTSRIPENRRFEYTECDQRPSFMGSTDPKYFLMKWVYQYLRYPKEAMDQGIQGRVMVTFGVDRDGKVVDVEVSKSVDPLLDAEAVKVISASPKWKPGKVKGKAVKSYMTLAVDFKLTKKGSFGIKK